jgi:crotonobetainyl-CoA:carnitine CoA-transferase CaiB-like acyl-CoA transferase
MAPIPMASTMPVSDESSVHGALHGIRVLDLTTVLMGPSATQMLGDLGADVIKVEPPAGDTGRYVGAARHRGMAGGFLQNNRNKRSIVLDLKNPDGHAALLRLAARADVLIYNVRPQAMNRLGLSYDDVRAVRPDIVYVGMFGYGQTGPYGGRPAYDDLIQAVTGMPSLMAVIGDGVPRYLPVLIADRATGQAGVNAVLAALLSRSRTGRGQAIEIPMFETMVPFVLGEHMDGQVFDPPLGEAGYQRVLSRHRTAFATLDGHVAAVLYTDRHWQAFLASCGEPDRFATDPRLVDLATRTRHIDALYAELAERFRTRSTAQWMDLLQQADIPAAPLNTLSSLLADPHLDAVGFFRHEDHPSEGRIRMMAPLGTWSGTPPTIRRLAPRLGEHSREVLAEAGYDAGEIGRLIDTGACRAAA